VSDKTLWDESFTSHHLQVLYHQTPIQVYRDVPAINKPEA